MRGAFEQFDLWLCKVREKRRDGGKRAGMGWGARWGGGERGGREGRVAKWQSARAGWKDWYGLFS